VSNKNFQKPIGTEGFEISIISALCRLPTLSHNFKSNQRYLDPNPIIPSIDHKQNTFIKGSSLVCLQPGFYIQAWQCNPASVLGVGKPWLQASQATGYRLKLTILFLFDKTSNL
jgi:hypothetical protein